jgi:hypothetical protein
LTSPYMSLPSSEHCAPVLCRIQIEQLHKSPFSRILRNLSLQPSPCSYNKLDQRPVAILRARLRLTAFTSTTTSFCKLSLSPHCSPCPNTDESTQHVLFHCPTFPRSLRDCFSALEEFDCPTMFEVLTGDVSSIPPRHRHLALAATADLLLNINLHRAISLNSRDTVPPSFACTSAVHLQC